MPSFRPFLPLVVGALFVAPCLARADTWGPPGENMGYRSSHHALGPSLLADLGREGPGAGLGLRYQGGSLKERPYFRAALTGAPFERRYAAELGVSFHLGGLMNSLWWRPRVTADALVTVERGQLVPAYAAGLSLATLFGGSGRGWSELGMGLRAVLPPWNWRSIGPRLELNVTLLFGLHPWPRYPPQGVPD